MRPRWVMLAFMRLADLGTQLAYRISGGGVGGQQLAYSILLLHTIGRKSGKVRTHALLYIRDEHDFVVCASNFGADTNPAWYANLRANPRAEIQVGRARYTVVARPANLEDRARLWPKFLAVRSQYADYQAGTTRRIPLVILTPIADRQSPAQRLT